MTDFGLTSSYHVYDGLDQEEVFSPLFWRIFYDPLLCKVKRQESVSGLTSFFAAGTFMDDTIWVSNSQVVTQHILNVASEFFKINDISINNNKIVTIPINSWVANSSLLISGLPISVANRGESHQYLGIFLSTKGLSKPSLAKAHSDTIFDKQFSYLVSLVLHPIVNYRTQFSFVPPNFSNDALYYPLFYDLKPFEQIQAEHKVASVVCFANSVGVLGHLFAHRFHDLQVLCWHPIHPLSFPTHFGVGVSNNYLAGLVYIFYGYNLSLGGIRANAFCLQNETPIVSVLGESKFVRCFPSLRHYGIAFRLDLHGPVFAWFDLSVAFLNMMALISVPSSPVGGVVPRNVLNSIEFNTICGHLLDVSFNIISVFTDSSLAGLSTVGMWASMAVFFDGVDLGLGVVVSGLTIALALECVPSSSSVHLFSDIWLFQTFEIDAVKEHSGVVGNEQTDALAAAVSMSDFFLLLCLNKYYILADGVTVSGNSRHFVHDIFRCVHHAKWEVGSGSKVLVTSLHDDIDWYRSLLLYIIGCLWLFVNVFIAGLIPVFCACFVVKSNFLIMFSHVLSGKPSLVYLGHHHNLYSLCSLVSLTPWCVRHFEAVSVFGDFKIAYHKVVEFVDEVWLVRASHRALMKKCGLIPGDSSASNLMHGLSSAFSAEVIKLLNIAEAFGICFGFHTSCLFFLDIGDSVSVIIDA
ncbi:hypothetical protein G9A89_015779 [Geosiphon pyriformis]|nr:hypothetical protein G9A89_015779 [Geosiphon pyriformis]